MSRFRRPHVWLLCALLAVSAVGTLLLARPDATQTTQRELRFYLFRHYCNSLFDALSATCGAGLLVREFDRGFTDEGRWILTGLGVAGAVLYLLAAAQTAQKLRVLPDGTGRTPFWLIPLLFVGVQIVLGPLVWVAERWSGADAALPDAAQRACAAFSSLGWRHGVQTATGAWPVTLAALLGALGWPVWLLLLGSLGRKWVDARKLVRRVGTYLGILIVCAFVVTWLDGPRGFRQRVAVSGPAEATFGQRLFRGATQVTSAAGAGLPITDPSGALPSDGTKFVLAGLLVLGGMMGSATGGMQWPVLAWGLRPVRNLFCRRRTAAPPDPASSPLAEAATTLLLSMSLLVLVVGGGLLLIETHVASPFQPPPTFADALLDAASLVAGGGLTSGLSMTITDPNLSSGMYQSVDLYQYGMAWMALAMVVGRLLPVFVLWRAAEQDAPGLPRA